MVIFIRLLFLLFPFTVFSAEFIASVSRNQLQHGEPFTLMLTLKGAAAKGAPSIHSLKNLFIINSQQQSANTVITNGQINTSVTWRLSLIPQKEGDLAIPAITIETTEGVLSTTPITVHVDNGIATAPSDVFDSNGLQIITTQSKEDPYKNETIVYTVTLLSKNDLANVKIQPLAIDGAIVEAVEPKIYEKNIDGINVGAIDFNHTITLLNEGKIKIPSTIVQGGVVIKKRQDFNNIFDDDFDPFGIMPGFSRLKPFVLTTQETTLTIQPPVDGITPWLAAQSLKVEIITEEQSSYQVGDPFTLGFKIEGIGITSQQLPSLLNQLQQKNSNYKIYADNPELTQEVKNGRLLATKKELFTIIPQQAGSLQFPELTVIWWNTSKKEKSTLTIPSRTIAITPGPSNAHDSASSDINNEEASTSHQQELQKTYYNQESNVFLYIICTGLLALLFGAVCWTIILQKKIQSLASKKSNPNSHDPVKEIKKHSNGQKDDNTRFQPPHFNNQNQNPNDSQKEQDVSLALPKEKSKNENLPNLNPT